MSEVKLIKPVLGKNTFRDFAEWFLSEEDFALYLKNFDPRFCGCQLHSTLRYRSDLLNDAFNWRGTPQGHDYWKKIHEDFSKDLNKPEF